MRSRSPRGRQQLTAVALVEATRYRMSVCEQVTIRRCVIWGLSPASRERYRNRYCRDPQRIEIDRSIYGIALAGAGLFVLRVDGVHFKPQMPLYSTPCFRWSTSP